MKRGKNRHKTRKKKFRNNNDFPFFPVIIIIVCIASIILIEKTTDSIGKNVCEDILIAILASYIFAFTLNLPRPLVINDHLIIRERESQVGNPVSISLLVGCPWRRLLGSIYDVKCTFIYIIDNGAGSNAAFIQSDTRDWINHYYRFSFELKDLQELQIKFWEEFLNGTSHNKILVTITGASNNLGGHFRYRKEYYQEQIIIGEDCFGALDKREKSTPSITRGKLKECYDGGKRSKLYWKEFRHCWNNTDESIKEKIIQAIREGNHYDDRVPVRDASCDK